MIKAIVFDFNGVFVQAPEMSILEKICIATGAGKWIALSNYYINVGRCELGFFQPFDFWKKVFPLLGKEEYLEFVEKEFEKRLPRNEELYSLCAELSKSYALYCISNSNFLQGKAYRKQKLYAPFMEVFLSHETGRVKPMPGAFSNFLQKTGLKAEECVFVDDKKASVFAAGLLGFKAVHFTGNDALKKKFSELGLLSSGSAAAPSAP